jgi:hypothetical protein
MTPDARDGRAIRHSVSGSLARESPAHSSAKAGADHDQWGRGDTLASACRDRSRSRSLKRTSFMRTQAIVFEAVASALQKKHGQCRFGPRLFVD